MQNVTNEHDTQTRPLSGVWNEQAGPHFDLIILILAVVNVTAACGISSTILYDARVLAKFRSFSTHPYTTSFMGGSRRIIDIHPAEVLPLVVSIATILQGIVYIIVQIIGLRTLVAKCDSVAQVVWPEIGLILGSGLLFTNVVCAVVITTQLMRTTNIDHNQRIAASRVVYYLIVSASLMTLTVPFFAQRTLQSDALWTAWVAEVSLNLIGLITLILHLCLRSNADTLAIQPLEGTRQDKKRLRLFGPSDLEMTMHITSPALLKKANHQYTNENRRSLTVTRTDSPTAASETERNDSRNGDLMNEIVEEYSRPVPSPSQAFVSPSMRRKGSNYSLFPTFRSAMLRNSVSTTFSQDDDSKVLQLPRPVAAFNHKRDLSEQSSATVQIGFRLSSMSEPQRPTTLSPRASSCCLPLQRMTDSCIESPPVSPMSSGPAMARTTPQDPMHVALQPHPDAQAVDAISPLQIRYRDGRQDRSSTTTPKIDRPMTMKALPPIPSILR
ncbi:MAG: hypothetical protein Q9215_007497 [Flavoplaca cf. flavocitrina]